MNDREAFEAAVSRMFQVGEHSFKRDNGAYYNHVTSQTYGGRVQPGYAPVSMLWDVWQAARRASTPD